MVLDILLSPAAADSIQLGTAPIISGCAYIIAMLAIQLFVARKCIDLSNTTKTQWNKRYNKHVILPLIFLTLIEKLSYGALSLYNRNEITMLFNAIPLYQPLTFGRLANKYFDFKAPVVQTNTINKNGALNYPLAPITFKAEKNKPHIFVITIDSLSKFAVNKENTPNIHALANDAYVFKQHYSGGNATRFGIFSLFYGLNSSYWFPALNENKGPVLIDALKQLDYQINIVSSTNADWPEFRKTAYVNVATDVLDKFDGSPWEKDRKSTTAYLDKISNVEKPQFSFLFLDAPHGYSYPPNHNKYHANDTNINYLTIGKDSPELAQVLARYKNAAFYNDALVGEVIRRLKRDKLYDDSIIIFTADHGQEFYEQGYFAHNSAFTTTQIQVPFIIKLPGNEHHSIDDLSSHNDFVPTLLTYLGVNNPSSDYSNGFDLLGNTYNRKYIYSANWNNNAVVSNGFTYVFSNLPNKMFKSQIRDNENYKHVIDGKKINPAILMQIMDDNKRFSKR